MWHVQGYNFFVASCLSEQSIDIDHNQKLSKHFQYSNRKKNSFEGSILIGECLVPNR